MSTGRIDVHQHIVPPEYARWVRSKGVADAAGRALPDWDAGAALELMDRHNIRMAILSVSTPGTTPGEPAEAAEMARAVNEFSASLSDSFPSGSGTSALCRCLTWHWRSPRHDTRWITCERTA